MMIARDNKPDITACIIRSFRNKTISMENARKAIELTKIEFIFSRLLNNNNDKNPIIKNRVLTR